MSVRKFNDWRDTIPSESDQEEVKFVSSADDLNFAPSEDFSNCYSVSKMVESYGGYLICSCRDLKDNRLWYEAIEIASCHKEDISRYKFSNIRDIKDFINKKNQ